MTCTLQPRFISDARPGNPFATRYTRPGAVVPLDCRGRPIDLDGLIERLGRLGGAAIAGPHGHGKSTLLLALADRLAASGTPVTLLRVRRRGDARGVAAAIAAAPRGAAVLVDGWEGLGWLGRPLAVVASLRARTLLVTTHRVSGLPVLWHCRTSLAVLRGVVARLPDHHGLITATDLDAAFGRHGGNLRDSLSDLYDRVEHRAAGGPDVRVVLRKPIAAAAG